MCVYIAMYMYVFCISVCVRTYIHTLYVFSCFQYMYVSIFGTCAYIIHMHVIYTCTFWPTHGHTLIYIIIEFDG